jgi:predicted RNA-binding Zn-ribbon protein involved in translation (DUF1610 family)
MSKVNPYFNRKDPDQQVLEKIRRQASGKRWHEEGYVVCSSCVLIMRIKTRGKPFCPECGGWVRFKPRDKPRRTD